MLVNLYDVMQSDIKGSHAVASFNVFGYEDARAIISAAEARNATVILSINMDMRQFMPLEEISGLFRPMAHKAQVPVCLHLDHTYDIGTVKQAVDCGFTSVMFDGSQQPLTENIASIRKVVAYARPQGVSVEAEVGSVPYASGRDHIRSALTEVVEAVQMAEQGQPDAIAISVGNVHRLEHDTVAINFNRFTELEQALELPLVIHGTSGINESDIQHLASRQVAKFNIGTCLRQSFGHALREALEADPKIFDRLELMQQVIPKVSATATRMIKLLGQ